MKILIMLSLAALLASGCASKNSASSSAQVSAKAKTPATPLVLDVRTPEEFQNGHIDGAVNVPIDDLASRIDDMVPDKNTPIRVHCQSGGRSARAKKLLDSKGYAHVEDLGSLAHARQVVAAQNQPQQ